MGVRDASQARAAPVAEATGQRSFPHATAPNANEASKGKTSPTQY